MKRRILSFLAMLLCSMAALAEEFVVDGIKYNVTSTDPLTVEVTSNGYGGYSGDIVIPKTVECNNEEYTVTSIGGYAFHNCRGLTSIDIPNSVTSIGYQAFDGCSCLTSITIPNSLTSIGGYAFHNCSGLTSITIPNSVTSIGDNAFKGCSGLTTIVIEAGNTVYDSRNNCNAIIKTETNELIAGCQNTVIPNTVTSIGGYAFHNCRGLTSIDIPNSVTSIGYQAFDGCSCLTSITIPNSLTSIGWCAFQNCSGLTSIVVEAGNTVYDSRNNCNAIIITETNELIVGCKNTVIPNSVTSIGGSAFQGCSGLTSLTIPNSVTSIGDDAFYSCSGLTSITIPNFVTSIGRYAFDGCSGLTSITIPNFVTSIGRYAFDGCSGLTSVTVGSTTPIAVGSDCFVDSNIGNATLYVPAGCVEAYQAADNWKDFNKIEEFFTGTMTDEQGVKYTANNVLTCYVSGYEENCDATIVIPIAFKGRTVSSIESNVFKNYSGLTTVVIPNSVTSIGSGAFSGCSGLTNVTVASKTPIVITDDVFTNRTNATLYVPAGCVEAYQAAEYWKEFNKIEEMFTGTVADDQGVKYTANNDGTCYVSGHEDSYSASIVIPKIFQGTAVTSIGGSAFRGCSGLTSVTIPSSVTSIGGYTFYACSGLTSIDIPNSVTSIGGGAFMYCSGLTSIVIEAGNSVYDSRNDCNAIIKTETNELIVGCQNTVIPNTVTSIGGSAFRGCSGLTSITIPNSVTGIGGGAFMHCRGLTSVTVGATSPVALGSDCFVDSNIGNATLYVPTGCIEAYQAADNWKDFNKIEELYTGTMTDGQGVKYTANNDLTCYVSGHEENCNAAIVIPVAFKGRTVSSIGNNAFKNCNGLTSVVIPNFVTNIGSGAFFGCNGLTNVTVCSRTPVVITDDVFTNRTNATLFVPAGCVEAYQAADYWKEFNKIKEIFTGTVADDQGVKYTANDDYTCYVSGHADNYNASIVIPKIFQGRVVTSIGDRAFMFCSGLTSITIPNSVTSIGNQAFFLCSGLTSITIPNSVTSIGDNAFDGCSCLTSITIPNSLTSIGDYAFKDCSGLTSIVVDAGNTVYDSRNNCNAIIKTETNELIVGCKNTVIPNTVTSIGNDAFEYCSGLTSIDIPNTVTSIGNQAFEYCSGLTSIDIPNTVTSIGYWAFFGCYRLTSVTVGATTPVAIDNNCFTNRENATLYVPKGSKAAYEAADYWKEFKEIKELEPEPISITMATASGTARDMIGYSSECGLDFTDVEDVKAYVAVAFDKNLVTYLSRVYVVPARTGIVLKTTKPGITVNVPITDDDVYMANLLIPAVEQTVVQPSETIDNVEYTNLMVGKLPSANTMGFVKFSSPVTTSKKCYLRVPSKFFNASAPALERGGLEMVFDDESTTDFRAIEGYTIMEQNATTGDRQVYDLQGRKVTTAKGLVIQNGKLIFVKP